jgi:hypothetical protein
MLDIGVQDMVSISKDKLFSIFQESNIGYHVEQSPHIKYKNSYLFGIYFQLHGIIKVIAIVFRIIRRISKRATNWIIIN